MGAGLGTGAIRWPKVGILGVGATIGFVVAKITDMAIISPFVEYNSNVHSWWLGAMIALACLWSFFYFDQAIIICSCMCGSYILFRGISIFMGGYPSELFMALVMEKGSFKDLRPTFWIYFTFMLISFVGSAVWQFYHRSQHAELYTYRTQSVPNNKRYIQYANQHRNSSRFESHKDFSDRNGMS